MTLAPLALVREGAAELERAGCDTPQLDAEILVASALGIDRVALRRLPADPLPAAAQAAALELLQRRSAREPVSQIIGRRWFRRIELQVTPEVLTPRPESELLVEYGIALPEGARVADIGTGSGAIAIALADERPDLDIVAADVDQAALAVASANAAASGADVALVLGDLLDAVPGALDAVISNPPYIPEGDLAGLDPEVRDYEPAIALVGGEDGLDVVRRLVSQAAVRRIERIALEVGAGQADEVALLLSQAGWSEVDVIDDLAGIARVVSGTGFEVAEDSQWTTAL